MGKSSVNKNLNKIALKSGSWYTISNILIRSVSIITAPIFTRILSTSDYGVASNFLAWQNIALIFTGLCLSYSIGRAKLDFEDEFDSYLSSIQTLATITAFIFLILAILFSYKMQSVMQLDRQLIIILFVYIIFYPSVDFAQVKFRYLFNYKANIIISIINTLGVVLFSIVFIFLFNNERYLGRIIGIILPMFLLGGFFHIKIALKGKSFVNLRYWKYALKISVPMIPHALAMVILDQIDRIQITKYCGSADVGIYSFGYSYAILLSVFINAIFQAWTPWLYEKYNDNSLIEIRKSNMLINILMCVLTTGFILVGPEALKILGTKEFFSGKVIIFPVAVGTLCQYFYNNYCNIEIYHKKTLLIPIGSAIAAAIVYILNIIFIPIYGFVAASYTTLIGYLFLMVFHNLGYRIIAKKKIFNELGSYLLLSVTTIISFALSALYDFTLIRYLLCFIIIAALLIIYKNSVIIMVKKMKAKL